MNHYDIFYRIINNRWRFADWHVDDSEVTLSVCLGKEFTGGEMYFNGRRCENHTTSMEKDEVV